MRQHTIHDQTGSTPGQSPRGGTERTTAQVTGPAAERARTVLATAGSAGVTPTGRDEPTVSVWLTEHDGRLMVQATADAPPDPFARFEPGLLAHLESAHGDVVAALVGVAGPRVTENAAGSGR
jgi:hypothetical protein